MGSYDFDVWYIKEADYGPKLEFLRTLSVSQDMSIQDVRKEIQSEIYPSLSTKIDLEIYKVEAVRNNKIIQIMMQPSAPHVLLTSDKSYTVKTVVDTIKTSYEDDDELNKFFTLKLLPRLKIIARLHNEI